MTRRSRSIAAIALAAVTTGILAGCAPGWARSHVYLSDLLTNPDGVTTTGAREATDELCVGLDGCLEAWTTDQAYFYRFESNAQAEQLLTTVTDGFQSGRIAVSFDETAPSEQVKQWMRDLVEGAHSLT
ncbi:hypothetical protein [Microbacterium sp. NPDC076895]|uniref:hypothetical protein n=1 Tax=Microbacterium sp. NPDC076895 TaxID=3154957 RepID=UPI00341CA253